jgi:hypothetical protein
MILKDSPAELPRVAYDMLEFTLALLGSLSGFIITVVKPKCNMIHEKLGLQEKKDSRFMKLYASDSIDQRQYGISQSAAQEGSHDEDHRHVCGIHRSSFCQPKQLC